MKKILVPTNFSRASLAALKVAVAITKWDPNIQVRLAHSYHVHRHASVTNVDYGYDVPRQRKQVDEIHKKLNEIAKKDFVKGVKIETQVVPHLEVLDLLNYKDNKDTDLIICGIHGSNEGVSSIEGTHTEKIIRHAHCPVLCVHENIKEPIRFDDIVFASDFSRESLEVFPLLKKVFNALRAKIHLVKVITPHNFENTPKSENMMKDFAKKEYLTNYTIKVFNDETIELGIHRYAYSVNANIIAMETHGYTGFIQLLKGSVTEAVALHSELSVMSVKIPGKA